MTDLLTPEQFRVAALLLLALWLPAHAEPAIVFDSVERHEMGWRISTRPTAAERPIPMCGVTLYDVLAGERIHLQGFAQVDAPGDWVGTNIQVAYCDDVTPQCNYSGRWDYPHNHMWDAGNLNHHGEHHKPSFPQANYVSTHYQQSVTFNVFVNIYGPRGRFATADDCQLTWERYRP